MLFMTQKDTDGERNTHQEEDCREDAALVSAACAGDGHAFEKLVRKYEKFVYRTAYYSAQNAEDAADLTQEIFMKVWHGLPTFGGQGRFLSWLARIARNTCCDYVRSRHRAVQTQPLDLAIGEEDDPPCCEIQDPSPDADPHMVLHRKENADLIREAMSQLSAEHRMMIVMRDIDGDSYETIASALDLEIGTVKSRLSRAREKLRGLLAERGFFE